VLLGGGTRNATTTFFPYQPSTKLMIKPGGFNDDIEIVVQVNAIESDFAKDEDESGNMIGNVASSGNSTKAKRHMANET
jgi:hypothetical protein